MTALDLAAIKAEWLNVCGSCDAGLPMACSCPAGDPRGVIAALVALVERRTSERDALRAAVEDVLGMFGPVDPDDGPGIVRLRAALRRSE